MDEFEKFYTKAIYYLTTRPRSEKELSDYLKKPRGARFGSARKNVDPVVIEQVISTLKKQKFLDDTAFVKWWVEQRNTFKPRSKRLLFLELLRKGIKKEFAERIISKEEGLQISDVEQAKRLLQKKIERYKNLSFEEKKVKLQRFLLSKGFNYDAIRQSIDEILGKGV